MAEVVKCRACFVKLAPKDCDLCGDALCENCAENPVQLHGPFYYTEMPEALSAERVCPRCMDSVVATELEKYNVLLERAKQFPYWNKKYRGPIPVTKKAQKPIEISEAADRQEALLRVAFRAVELGYDGLVQVEYEDSKVRNFGYQKTHWRVVGVPVKLNQARLEAIDQSDSQ